MRRTKPVTIVVAIALIPAAFVAGRWLRIAGPGEYLNVRADDVYKACDIYAGSGTTVLDRINDELFLRGTKGCETQTAHRRRVLELCQEAPGDAAKQAACYQCYGTIVDHVWSTPTR